MSETTAIQVYDFLSERVTPGEPVHIGFFGGEPLLEFQNILSFTEIAKKHKIAADRQLTFQIVSNGTLLTSKVIDTISRSGISLGISCDGVPEIQDRHRKFLDGSPSSASVESNIRSAAEWLPSVMVNSVYRPDTIDRLADGLDYFYRLGVRRMYMNPDYSAQWHESDLIPMRKSYSEVLNLYEKYHLSGDPAYISLIDNKVTVLLNGGYSSEDHCSMGRREFAFGPEGYIYPCERLAGDCVSPEHRIGHVLTGIDLSSLCRREHAGDQSGEGAQSPCISCSVKDYCMNWCGCSNFFSTGDYDSPGPFICASEKESLSIASSAIESMINGLGQDYIYRLKQMQPTTTS
jgi:uncharacterized protein